ncbi:hypothetical protein SSTU70S_06565 [Stutzerimonas stutzeri]
MTYSNFTVLPSKKSAASFVFESLKIKKIINLCELLARNTLACDDKQKIEKSSYSPKIKHKHSFKKTADWTYEFLLSPHRKDFWIYSITPSFKTFGKVCFFSSRIKFEVDTHVAITLSRDGTSSFDGASKKIWFRAGIEQLIRLEHQFNDSHERIKFQIEILSSKANSGLFEVSYMFFSEVIDSFEMRTAASLTVAEANSALIKGHHYEAMMLNLILYKKNRLNIYRFNIERAAKALFGRAHDLPLDLLIK